MKQFLLSALAAAILGLALPAFAQNVAIVNGKAVPKARVDALAAQLAKSGRPVTPELQGQLKDEVIAREIFMQEAQKRGLDASDDFKNQMELARQTLLIRELFADHQKKNPVTDAEIKAEYDKFVVGQRRQGIPRPPHPGREGRRGQGDHRVAQEGRQVRRHRQEAVQGPGLRRQRRRPRLGQRGQLRSRVLAAP